MTPFHVAVIATCVGFVLGGAFMAVSIVLGTRRSLSRRERQEQGVEEQSQGGAAVELTPYSALVKILDVHYQAQSNRYPEGECATCSTYSSVEQTTIGVRYPCETRRIAESALDPAP